MLNIGVYIKNARAHAGMTQEDLATLLGKSKNVVSNWERGDNKPDIDSFERMCQILRLDPSVLFGETNSKNKSPEAQHIAELFDLADEHDKDTVRHILARYETKGKKANAG